MLAAREQPALSDGIRTVFVGIEDLGCFGHEADAAKDDDVLIGHRGLAGEVQRIAHEVRDGMEERRLHVVMAQDHCVALDLELVDLIGQLGLHAQLEIRRVLADARLEITI